MNVVFARIVEERRRVHTLRTHLPDEPVTVLDLLDALASAGFRLEVDRIGYAREAYVAEASAQLEASP